MPPSAVSFDLDGTLVDSRRDLARAVDLMLADLGRQPLGLDAVTGMIGRGSRDLVTRALAGASGAPRAAGAAEIDAALSRFALHYREVAAATTRPYPGVSGVVARLAERAPLAVVTNKPESESAAILAAVGLRGYFRTVVGGDSAVALKPDPAPLRLAAARLGVEIERLVHVGDSVIDAATAAAAGCPFVAVGWGYASAAERAELERGAFAADADALARLLLAGFDSLPGRNPERARP